MLIPIRRQLHQQPGTNPSRPHDKNPHQHKHHNPTLRNKQSKRRQHHNRQHTIPNQTQTPVQIQIPIPPSQHVKHHIQKQRGHSHPPQNNPKMQLPSKQLKQSKRHKKQKRTG
ncbi:hypothetical protein HanIR_Chr08g0355121 [Helianthus annuus]|nr:hypothetical protein HanIR_Chr08g0355121 [Helianthus annuus]